MKKIISFLILLVMLLPIKINALENTTTYYEYLNDGSYYEITIEENSLNTRSTTKSGSKTVKYKDANGEDCWYVKVTGIFIYNGTSATCTSSSVSAGVYKNIWKIANKTSSKSGASAKASATARLYYVGAVVDTKTKSITLTCSANGKLS